MISVTLRREVAKRRASKGDGPRLAASGRSSFEALPAQDAGVAPQDDGEGSNIYGHVQIVFDLQLLRRHQIEIAAQHGIEFAGAPAAIGAAHERGGLAAIA